MQVVILCGGQGTRIRDVADDIPKPMIPIGGQPILWHIMRQYACHGFRDFVLCLGYKGWVIKRYFLDYHLAHADLSLDLGSRRVRTHGRPPAEDWRVTLAETGVHAMTGCRIKRVEKYVAGEHFLLTYGDGVADVDLTELVQFHLGHGKVGTVCAVRPPSRFGEIELDGPRVAEFNEKPLAARGRINGGFFMFRREFFDRLRDDEGLVLEGEPLVQLARDGELMAYLHDGFWQCMDSSRDYQYLNKLWAEGKASWATPEARPGPPAAGPRALSPRDAA
jgi:glucose-1-phosphate cytidylyltransferase